MTSASEVPTGQSGRPRMVAGLIVLIVLAGLVVASLAAVAPPAPVAADAPADAFSATRAYQHVERIGSQQHVAGSAAAADVRDYIVATLAGFGLDPQIQDGIGATSELGGQYGMAGPQRRRGLPGTTSTGRLIMLAHYDSVQVSYGGNDDGAGVSTLLETARALTAGPPPRERHRLPVHRRRGGLPVRGARLSSPATRWPRGGGVVLNFESRGSSGPVVMFETSPGNADLVASTAAAVPYPVATSLAVEVYRILPNDTDFTPFRDSGRFTGLNSAYIDGSAVYHAPEDTPQYMDRASLQHQGDNALALTRAFGARRSRHAAAPASRTTTYFPAMGAPGPLSRLAGLAVGVLALLRVLALAVARPRAGARRLGRGCRPASVWRSSRWCSRPLPRRVLGVAGAAPAGYANMLDPWWPGWFRAAWWRWSPRSCCPGSACCAADGAWSLAIGALGLLAVLGVVMAAVVARRLVPGRAAGAGRRARGRWSRCPCRPLWARVVARAARGAVAVAILAPTVYLFFPALGLATGAAGSVVLGHARLGPAAGVRPALPAVAAAVAGAAVGVATDPDVDRDPGDRLRAGPADVPAAAGVPAPRASTATAAAASSGRRGSRAVRRRWAAMPALTAGVLTLAFFGAGLAVDHFDEAHPAPAQLFYALDTDTGQARWVSTDADPGEWVSQYVTGPEDLRGSFGLLGADVLSGPAQAAALPAPAVAVAADRTSGDRRTLSITVTPQRDARLIYLLLPGAVVSRASVAGQEIPTSVFADWTGVVFNGPPDRAVEGGVTFDLELDSAGPVTVG